MIRSYKEFPEEETKRVSSILESIARRYAQDSDEYHALEETAHAFMFLVRHESLKASYIAYRMKIGKPLTQAHKAHLKSLGIESD
ncbi:MAG: hypothetical protein ABSH28_10065 [Acidobacteriota bacterium]|jgi:hypothetical protein